MKAFLKRHERIIGPLFFGAGFVIDNLTLNRIDEFFDNMVLVFYLALAVLSILILSASSRRGGSGTSHGFFASAAPFIMQYAFGGLFSGFLIFYFRASALGASWPFLIILVLLFFANERGRENYTRTTFQIAVLYIAALAYSVFVIPIILHRMGDLVFLLSGLVSLLVIYLLGRLISFVKGGLGEHRASAVIWVVAIYLVFNLMYFTNIIPPIPLSLKDSGVYHHAVRVGNNYELRQEVVPWYRFWDRDELNVTPGSTLYVYASIFAPTDLTERVVHRWQKYNPVNDRWENRGEIPFDIVGGRGDGYRGYTFNSNIDPGLWRVRLETTRGQVLGSEKFEVIYVQTPPKTELLIK